MDVDVPAAVPTLFTDGNSGRSRSRRASERIRRNRCDRPVVCCRRSPHWLTTYKWTLPAAEAGGVQFTVKTPVIEGEECSIHWIPFPPQPPAG